MIVSCGSPTGTHSVSDASFPRKTTLEHVLHVVRTQPRLSKEASSLLIDLGEAIHANATRDEVGVLIDGTLLQETRVRNSCLQALQVCSLACLPPCFSSDARDSRLI